MKIVTVIEDTPGSAGCVNEHGLCIYVETKKHRLLMDTGASDAIFRNAQTLGIDMTAIDTVILSHGHYDHSGGILELVRINPRVKIYMKKSAAGNYYHNERYIGIDKRAADLEQVIMTESDFFIDEELFLFTGADGDRCRPESNAELTERMEECQVQDRFIHEQYLVITQGNRRILMSGCAHNGILNILDRYRSIFCSDPSMVFSGFHMAVKHEFSEEETEKIKMTAVELAGMNTVFYTGHCTGEPAFQIMKEIMGEKLVHMHPGTSLEFAAEGINLLTPGCCVGITGCSDGIDSERYEEIKKLEEVLGDLGLKCVISRYLSESNGVFSIPAKTKAEELMDFYRNPQIHALFDISGGDLSNEVLPLLDFAEIAGHSKQFWGYSDLTAVINGIMTQTGNTGVLYQVRNLLYDHSEEQQKSFADTVLRGGASLTDIKCRFIQGSRMEGIAAGGNIRCLLKLAGTSCWPDLTGRILLLEAWGSTPARMDTALSQLSQMGVFDKISGIILGTFTEMDSKGSRPDIEELVLKFAGENIPVVRTRDIGHGTDSKAIVIGSRIRLTADEGLNKS